MKRSFCRSVLSCVLLVFAGVGLIPSYAVSPCVVEVQVTNSFPRLYVDGEALVPMAYKTLGKASGDDYWESCLETVALARDAGLHIYQIRIGLNTLGLPRKLIRGETITIDFSEMNEICAVDSNALFIVGLSLIPDPYYRSHNQMCATNLYPQTEDYSGMVWNYNISTGQIEPHDRQSPLSEKIWQDVEASVSNVVSALEASYGDRIIMYWPAFSDVGEWYYGVWSGNLVPGFGPCTVSGFQTWASNKYTTVSAMNTAWDSVYTSFGEVPVPSWAERNSGSLGELLDPDEDRYVVDFFDFFNGTMNSGAERIAAVLKDLTDGNKLVGMFWQYMHPVAYTSIDKAGLIHSGHLKLMELLECPDIDALGTPLYPQVEHWRMPFHGTVDTIQKHGKLFWHENDMATHLSDHPEKSSGIDETLSVYAYDFQEWIERQCGFWFFDIVVNGETNSILNDEDIWNYIGDRVHYWEQYCLTNSAEPFAPEIAVIRNEKTARHIKARNSVLPAVYSSDLDNEQTEMIHHLTALRDAPVGWYMLEDFLDGNIPDSVEMFIFADTFTVDRADAFDLLDRLDERPGCMAVWFYAPGYIDPNHLGTQDSSSIWFVNRLTGGIKPLLFDSSIEDTILPVTHTLTDGVSSFGTEFTNLDPQFYIDSGLSGVETLGVYADDTNKIAAAISPLTLSRVWDSVYICSPAVDPELLKNLAERLGLRRVDGFNDDSLSQWTNHSGQWDVDIGELSQTLSSGTKWISLDDYSASNLTAEVDISVSGSGWAGLQFRKTDADHNPFESGYLVHVRNTGYVTLYKPGGAITGAGSGADPATGFICLKVEVNGSGIKVFCNGNEIIDVADTSYSSGYVGLCTGACGSAVFDRFSVKSE